MRMPFTVDPERDASVRRGWCIHRLRPTGIRGVKRNVKATDAAHSREKGATTRWYRTQVWIDWVSGGSGRSRARFNWEISATTISTRSLSGICIRITSAIWPPPASEKPLPPDPSRRVPLSDMIAGGKLDVKDVLQPIYDEINKQYGLKE